MALLVSWGLAEDPPCCLLYTASDNFPTCNWVDSKCYAGCLLTCSPGPALTFTKGFPLGARAFVLEITCLGTPFSTRKTVITGICVVSSYNHPPLPIRSKAHLTQEAFYPDSLLLISIPLSLWGLGTRGHVESQIAFFLGGGGLLFFIPFPLLLAEVPLTSFTQKGTPGKKGPP
jgi:hypothetical protein